MVNEPSKYMRQKFNREFREGMEFWTGEDGEPVCYVVPRSEIGLEALYQYLRERDITFEPERLHARFVFRDAANRDWPGAWPDARMIWAIRDESSPFPVYEYEY